MNYVKKIICLIIGMIFMLLGFIGLLLPVIPQIPFLVTGIVFLMAGSKRFAGWIKDNSIYQQHVKPLLLKNKMIARLVGA